VNLIIANTIRGKVWGAQMRSCSSPVLVNQTAEQVTPLHPARAILADGDQLSG
jgi:hypothetical protein